MSYSAASLGAFAQIFPQAAAGGMAIGVAARYYGENSGTDVNGFDFGNTATNASGSSSYEKLNSRSANSASTISTGATAGNRVILCKFQSFSHQSYIPNWRLNLRAINSELLLLYIFAVAGSAPSLSLAWRESDKPAHRKVSRRTTKPGYFPHLGNQIAHYQKTGGGAYSIKAPNFDNDIVWVDADAWRFPQFALNVPLLNVAPPAGRSFGWIIG